MKNKKSFLDLVKQIFNLLSKKNVRRYYLLIIFIIATAMIEIISIGSILPFLAGISDPEALFNSDYSFIWQLLGIQSHEELPMILTIFFIVVILLAGLMRIMMVYLSSYINRSIIVEMGSLVFSSLVYRSISEKESENTSLVKGIIASKLSILGFALNGIAQMFSGIFISLAVMALLLVLEPSITLYTLIIFGVMYSTVIKYFNKRIQNNSLIAANNISEILKLVNETLHGFREVILNRSQEFLKEDFESKAYKLRTAEANNAVIQTFPRFLVESVGLLLLALFALYYIGLGGSEITEIVPTLALFALAFQRLMPLVQQIYTGWTVVSANSQSIQDTISYITIFQKETFASKEAIKKLYLREKIKLEKISFRYDESNEIIKSFSIEISKGNKIGICGKTGTGKTTLSDLLMGFQLPNHGNIYIDSTLLDKSNVSNWQANISHVPQKIFIKDGTVADNVALSSRGKEHDLDKIKSALIQAKLENFPLNYEVGEDGCNLSGGQIQRIGIARAIYKESDIIFFDEPTSSLDEDTENKIFEAIYSIPKDRTIFIISHNVDALANCDIVIETTNNGISIIKCPT